MFVLTVLRDINSWKPSHEGNIRSLYIEQAYNDLVKQIDIQSAFSTSSLPFSHVSSLLTG